MEGKGEEDAIEGAEEVDFVVDEDSLWGGEEGGAGHYVDMVCGFVLSMILMMMTEMSGEDLDGVLAVLVV